MVGETGRRDGASRDVLRQRAARVRVGTATVACRRGRIRTAGFTVLELIVTMSVFSILLAVAMPRAQRSSITLWNANEQLLSDLRRTRADALTHGDHFILSVTGPYEYTERRMRLVGAEWLPVDPPVRTRTLPDGLTFSAGVGEKFEFNTRGLLVTPDQAGNLQLQDPQSGHMRGVVVWPSGQVVAS
jgi:prepilin-type N-terminal cleavage/methylation domain-containing protein